MQQDLELCSAVSDGYILDRGGVGEIKEIAEKRKANCKEKSDSETVDRAYELTLSEGVLFERRAFHAMFATNDQKEGMAAFVQKR